MSAEAKFFRVSKLRSLREAEQVAAVCYRMRDRDIEFLLVQTGGGRWIFPKGGVETGLTHAQAAALEAFEEAGVHGRIEEEPFTRYRVRRPGKRGSGKQTVTAHLCEVLRLVPPQEAGRNRTWFSTEKTKRSLREDRPAEEGKELARVVQRAVVRIEQSQCEIIPPRQISAIHYKASKDPLQKVQIESPVIGASPGQTEALYMRYVRRMNSDAQICADHDASTASLLSRPLPQLGGAATIVSAVQNVTAIDQGRRIRGKTRNCN